MNKNILVQVNDVYKHFGPTKAVDGVSLVINKGEICGLVGENGSGKSTLLSLLSGIQRRDAGEIYLEGEKYNPKNLTDANKKGVSMIVQEANTIRNLTVAENMFLGIEDEFMKHGFRNIKKMNAMARRSLDAVGLTDIKEDEDVANYSMEQRKLIELVKASMVRPKLLMIDETSTALSQTGRDELYKLIHTTKERGDSILMISHDLQEVLTLCDRIIIMRDGKIVDEVASAEVDETRLKNLMVGREVSGQYYREDYDTTISDEVVMKVSNLSVGQRVKDVSFELHKGEILGFGGLSESGMHELGKAIFGIEYDVTGTVTLSNADVIKTIDDSVKHDIGYISKNRDTESLFNQMDINDNIAATCMEKIGGRGFVTKKKRYKFAEESAGILNVKMYSVEQIVGTLSGGNKQKVVLAKWIARGTEIFIMDSPTRGIDVGVKAIIYNMLDNLRKEGKSLIIISEELLELIGMCDRVIILKDGEISGEFKRSPELDEETLVQCMV